jgi:hypothetical protein
MTRLSREVAIADFAGIPRASWGSAWFVTQYD